MALDKLQLCVRYGGDVACFWRAVHNTFPLALVQSRWNLDRVYVGDTLVSLGANLDILSSLGFGTGTADDPMRIRAELVSDVEEESSIFYCEGGAGVVAAFNLVEEQVQLWELARHFDLWPWTAWVHCAPGKTHVCDSFYGRKGSRDDPFQLCGYYGPFPTGTVGSFITTSSDSLDLEVVNTLSRSFTVATYSVVISTTREHALLKLDYEPKRSCCMKLGLECDTLLELRSKGIMSPSLPTLVVPSQGWFQASGSLQHEFGAARGIITKPLGKSSVEGMVFHRDKLCKVAFDVLLGIYHLFLLGRKHRDVAAHNIVVTGSGTSDDQFMLVDLEYAYTVELEHFFGDFKEPASFDCQELLFCLLELSGHMLLDRSDHEDLAINILGQESDVLGEFAKHIYGLSHDAWPSFETWLNILGGSQGCNLPPEYVKEALAGRISSDRFSPPPLAFPPSGYPSAALWIIYEEQTKYFLPTGEDGLFPLAKVKHAWNLSEVSTVDGELVCEERRVSDVCGGVNGNGTREHPLRIMGKSGVPRFVRCQETVVEAIAALQNLPLSERTNDYTARVLVSGRKSNAGHSSSVVDKRLAYVSGLY